MPRMFVAVFFLLAATVGALAQSPAYVGTWASQPAQCRVGQEVQDAPLIMKAGRYDQHEAHCKFASVTRRGAAWVVKARCQVEGSVQHSNFTLSVSGTTLAMKEGGVTRALRRCP
jgi:hypothetical protein